MKIDPKQLAKDIEAIPVCDKGKDMIKALFTNNFGVKFDLKVPIKTGQIRLKGDGRVVMVVNVFSGNCSRRTMNLLYLRTGIIHTEKWNSENWSWVESCPVLADSLEEYYQGKKSAPDVN